MKPIVTFLGVMILVLGASYAFAHDDFRIIGTLTKISDSRIEVKSKDLKTTSIRMDKQTAVTRDKQKVATTELKVGSSVVVDAYGDSERDLLAIEVRIVPAITTTR
jgi:hypothetical protein